MGRTILQYQKAFNHIVDKMKADDSVLAVMVFGSMVTGDLWEESDVDLFVIVKEETADIRNIYTEQKTVPIHIKLMGKEKFLQIHTEDLRGGFMHRIFSSSRLVFSKDSDITSRYDSGRYYPDLDRERWCMVYLGNVLKNMSVCKKYLQNGGICTAYSMAVKCTEDFAKLYINISGYMISRDIMTMAMNLSDPFRQCVEHLFFHSENTEEAIESTLQFLERTIDENMKNCTALLLNYMREKDKFLSAEEIKKDKLFKDFDIDMEEILKKLWEKSMIKKENRDFKLENGKVLFKENVYFI